MATDPVETFGIGVFYTSTRNCRRIIYQAIDSAKMMDCFREEH
jgi:hypothetical protein